MATSRSTSAKHAPNEAGDTPGALTAYKTLAATGGQAAREILLLNRKLMWIADELKRIQPKAPGSVLLDLRDCGRGCMGCPHPRWIKWFAPKPGLEFKLLGARVPGDPSLALARSGKFEEHYREALNLVAEAKRLLALKSRLIAAMSQANKIVQQILKAETPSA
jgi:hypothetical protein